MEETFTERFRRLTNGLRESELAMVLDVSPAALRKIREGETQSLKLDAALRLCRRLGISPYELGGEREPGRGSTLNELHPALASEHDRIVDLETAIAAARSAVDAVQELRSRVAALEVAPRRRRKP